jgi:hypothetical protein
VSAAEVIEQIKALPPAEQKIVVQFVQEISNGHQVRYMDEQTFNAAVDKVFKEHSELLRKLAS